MKFNEGQTVRYANHERTADDWIGREFVVTKRLENLQAVVDHRQADLLARGEVTADEPVPPLIVIAALNGVQREDFDKPFYLHVIDADDLQGEDWVEEVRLESAE